MGLSRREVYDLARNAGLDHDPALVATAIAEGESGLNPEAVGDVGLQNDTWGPSVGLWQVRSLWEQQGTGQERDLDRLTEPEFNAAAMFTISGGGSSWQPWSIWKNGTAERLLPDVIAEVESEGGGGYFMQFVSRGEWGARAPRSTTAIGSALRGVACHWEGPHMGWPWGHESCAGKVAGIQGYHMDNQGWNDVAYNALVCGHGYVFEGRGPGVRSGANGDANVNATHYAICYLAGEGDEFTPEAQDAYNDAAEWLEMADGEWVGHRDLTQTACPGDEIYEWVHSGHPRAHAITGGDDLVLKEDERNSVILTAQILNDFKVGIERATGAPLVDGVAALVKALGVGKAKGRARSTMS